MSQSAPFDFAALVPGFDFLNKLASAPASAAPSVSSWVAPTLDPKELDKRIQDLRTVKFWLEQNTQAVDATIKALEVQRMTLATLQGMNVSMGQLAEALKVPADAATAKAASAAPSAAEKAPAKKRRASAAGAAGAAKGAKAAHGPKGAEAGAGVDPMAWWGALTQQFQQIAGDAMQEMQRKAQAQPPAAASPSASPAAAPTAAAQAKGQAGAARGAKRRASSRGQ